MIVAPFSTPQFFHDILFPKYPSVDTENTNKNVIYKLRSSNIYIFFFLVTNIYIYIST